MDAVISNLVKRFQDDWDLNELTDDDAFESFATYCVISQFIDDGFNPDDFRIGGGGDCAHDGFGCIINNKLYRDAAEVRKAVDSQNQITVKFIVIQAKTSKSFKTDTVRNLKANADQIYVDETRPYNGSEKIQNIVDCVKAVYADIAKLRAHYPELHIYYAATGDQVSGEILAGADSTNAHLTRSKRFSRVAVKCVNANYLFDAYHQASKGVRAVFSAPQHHEIPLLMDDTEAYEGLISATELVDKLLVDSTGNMRDYLFYENLRSYHKGSSVNKAIAETLRSSHQRMFPVMNHGVTIVARELSMVSGKFNIRGFQIVDGCQTCHVLFQERGSLDPDTQVKIQVVKAGNEKVINRLITATNIHNPVDENNFTIGLFHKKLEEFFTIPPPEHRLHYERRSKQYAGKDGIDPARIVTPKQLRRAYVAMFLADPAVTVRMPELMQKHQRNLFREQDPLDTYHVAATALYRFDWLVDNGRISKKYQAARFHVLAAAKLRLFDGPLPKSSKVTEPCNQALDKIWHATQWEELVRSLVALVDRAWEGSAAPLSHVVGTKWFAERFKQLAQAEND